MRTVNGHQCTEPCLQPSAGPCPRSLPNAWAPLAAGGGGQPAVQPQAPWWPHHHEEQLTAWPSAAIE